MSNWQSLHEDSAMRDSFERSMAQCLEGIRGAESDQNLGSPGQSKPDLQAENEWWALIGTDFPWLATQSDLGGIGASGLQVKMGLHAAGAVAAPICSVSHISALHRVAVSSPEKGELASLVASQDHVASSRDLHMATIHVDSKGRARGEVQGVVDAVSTGLLIFPALQGEELVWHTVKSRAAGVTETECRLLTDGGSMRSYQMDDAVTKRISRLDVSRYRASEAFGRSCLSAYAAGLAYGALRLTARYVQSREQFGRPLASFQAVKMRLSSMVEVAVGLDRLAEESLVLWDPEKPDADDVVSLAAASEVVRSLVGSVGHAQQLHGAMGFSLEYPMYRYTRAAYGVVARLVEDRPTIQLGGRLFGLEPFAKFTPKSSDVVGGFEGA